MTKIDEAGLEDVRVLVEALEWYAEQVKNCRKITSEGNDARNSLDADGGKRATAALVHYKGKE